MLRAHGFLAGVLCGLVLISACGEDDPPPHQPPGSGGSNGSGGKGTGGRASGGTGGSQSGGKPPTDAGPDGDIPDAPAPGTGGFPTDAPIIVWPPIEGGIVPEDAGPPAPRDCSPTGNATVSADPCTAFAEAECARYQACTPFTLIVSYGDVPACVSVLKRQCEATYGSPGQPPMLDAVHECAARWINAPCNCVLGETCPALDPKPGTLANGAGCYDARQCAGGSCSSTPQTCGECSTGSALGATCGRENTPCQVGLTCNSSGFCARPRDRGQRCSTTKDCSDDLACVDGKCGDPLLAGADCRSDPRICNPLLGLICDGMKCVQVEYTEASGDGPEAVCGPKGGTFILCSAKNLCSAPPFTSGQCQPRGGTGAQCDPAEAAERPACLPELECNPQTNECAAAGPIVCN